MIRDDISLIDFWERVNAKALHPAYQNMRFGQIAFSTLATLRHDLANDILGTSADPWHIENHMTDSNWMLFCNTIADNWEK